MPSNDSSASNPGKRPSPCERCDKAMSSIEAQEWLLCRECRAKVPIHKLAFYACDDDALLWEIKRRSGSTNK